MKVRIAQSRWSLVAVVSSLFFAGCDDVGHAPESGRLGRLVVSDGEVGRLTVVDLDEGTILSTFGTEAPASLHSGPGRRFAYAYQSSAGLVQIIDSGIEITSHGDHEHVEITAPVLSPFMLTGVAPVHFTHHDGQAVVFFDGAQPTDASPGASAHAVIVPEISLAQGMPESITIALASAQHGVAVPVGNGLIVSSDVPAATGAGNPLPNGVSVTDWEGNVLQTFDGSCMRLHGEVALSDDRIAFGCANHVLVVERSSASAPFTTRTLAYPDTRRSGALAASLDGAFLFGNHADDNRNGIIRIDVATGDVREIAFDAKVSEFATVPGIDDTLVVLTADGALHVVDTDVFVIVHTWQAVAPFTVSHASPHPALAVADDLVFVSDPEGGAVLEFELAHLEVGRRFVVSGLPASLVVLGPATRIDDDHAH